MAGAKNVFVCFCNVPFDHKCTVNALTYNLFKFFKKSFQISNDILMHFSNFSLQFFLSNSSWIYFQNFSWKENIVPRIRFHEKLENTFHEKTERISWENWKKKHEKLEKISSKIWENLMRKLKKKMLNSFSLGFTH